MSFRLNHYQLARALRILVTLEPNQPIASLSQAVKIIVTDWIAKHSLNAQLEAPQADIEAIKIIESLPVESIDPYVTIRKIMAQAKERTQPISEHSQQLRTHASKTFAQSQRDLEDEKLFQELRCQSAEKQAQEKTPNQQDLDEQISLAHKTSLRTKPSQFHDPNKTDSVISTVTDFSPPKEWSDQEV
jgi:hypothetical protein